MTFKKFHEKDLFPPYGKLQNFLQDMIILILLSVNLNASLRNTHNFDMQSCNISIKYRTYALSTLLHWSNNPFSAKATPWYLLA